MLPRSHKETLPYNKVYLYKSDIYQILISVTNHSLRKEQWRRTCNPKPLGLSQALHKVPFLQYNIQLDRVATPAVTRPRWCTAKGKKQKQQEHKKDVIRPTGTCPTLTAANLWTLLSESGGQEKRARVGERINQTVVRPSKVSGLYGED